MAMAKQQIGSVNQSNRTEDQEIKKKYSYSHVCFIKNVTNVHDKGDSQFNDWYWQTDIHTQESEIRTMLHTVEKSFQNVVKTLV